MSGNVQKLEMRDIVPLNPMICGGGEERETMSLQRSVIKVYQLKY